MDNILAKNTNYSRGATPKNGIDVFAQNKKEKVELGISSKVPNGWVFERKIA